MTVIFQIDDKRLTCRALVSALIWTLTSTISHAALPVGKPVVPAYNPTAAIFLTPSPETATMTVVAASGQPFANALHIETRKTPPNPWDVQVLSPTNAAITKGDTLLLTFYARTLAPGDGSAQISAGVEKVSAPYTKSLDFRLSPPAEWKRIDLPFTAQETYASGEARLHFIFGFAPQIIEIGGFSVTDYGPSIKLASLPHFSLTYPGREASASWRKEAQERIEKYRKASVAVHIVDASGKPIANTQVHLSMTRQAFAFGTAINSWRLFALESDGDQYRKAVLALFNRGVPEIDLKYTAWYRISPEEKQRALDLLHWGRSHQLAMRGHNLVWPSWRESPPQLQSDFLQEQRLNGSDAAREWLAAKITSHITEEVGALKGKCVEWDVINEPIFNHDFMDILGDSAMVAWLKAAHDADPAARLFVNNDAVLYGQSSAADVAAFQRVLRYLQEMGAPLGGIGLECHFGSGLASPDQIETSLTEYARFGVPLEITEFDFRTSDKELQADYTRDFLTLCFSHPAVTGVLMWGFWDGSHWLNDAPVYNADWTLKPSGRAILDLVQNQWWTDVRGKANALGIYHDRVFFGDYVLTATSQGRTKTVSVALTRSTEDLTVVL